MLKYLSEPRLPASPAATHLAWSAGCGLLFMIGWIFFWGKPLEEVSIIKVGPGFSLLVGILYLLYLLQHEEQEGVPLLTWQHVAMTPVVMAGWIYPFVVAYLAGVP